MNLIVDASVATKWFLDEEKCEEARLVLQDAAIVAPELILLETHNAVWKRWRRSEATAEQVDSVVPLLMQTVDRLHRVSELAPSAAALSRSLRHPIYDCLYVALAVRDGLPLLTADGRQFKLARQAGVRAMRLG
jgi:predicted nucleic acid-binding protein